MRSRQLKKKRTYFLSRCGYRERFFTKLRDQVIKRNEKYVNIIERNGWDIVHIYITDELLSK